MFFPIGDVNLTKGHKPFLTYLIIALNVAIFVWQFTMPEREQYQFVYTYGTIPIEIMHFQDWFTLLTNIFLHGGWFHLIGNMLFLWVFADNIEATLGYGKFILFYLAGGILASLTHIVLNPMSEIPCVGASGAIAACLGAYLVMFPSSKIKVLFIFILTSFRVPAIFFLGFWIIQQFTAGIGAIQASTAQTDGVAYWAHIGGFVFGVVVGLMYRSKAKELVATA